ncbi:hypothetical protein Aru02nite_45640 [Actinocatenispora rupis]|uniref:Uncharacterized protein n=1 Tax=Actinocatenispora rupis TaxID=519421 RepID=A0A8J3J810_9ACTN|nr:hypothetical protein Aru02nite_45640 [Actinocatenispora rupis]
MARDRISSRLIGSVPILGVGVGVGTGAVLWDMTAFHGRAVRAVESVGVVALSRSIGSGGVSGKALTAAVEFVRGATQRGPSRA